MRTRRNFILLAGASLAALACSNRDELPVKSASAPDTSAAPLMLFAAASLRDVLADVARTFEASGGGKLAFNFAGSNVLAQQIASAPGADVFIAANRDWIDKLAKDGHLVAHSDTVIAANSLVVIAHAASEAQLSRIEELPAVGFSHLAVGDPKSVPAGIYARQYLSAVKHAGSDLWSAVAARVAPAPDVRAALAMVEADPKVFGIVYRTDALASKRVRVLFEVPVDAAGAVVRYHAALVTGGKQLAHARKLLAFLNEEAAQAIFARHGFLRSQALAATAFPKSQ